MTQRWIHLLLVLGAVATGGSAAGQNRPPYQRMTADAVRAMAETLGLSAAESAEALAAHQRYIDELEQANATNRALNRWNFDHRIDLLYYSEDDATSNERGAANVALEQALQRGARELEERFFDELQSLAPGQESIVESLRRARLRERVLPIYGFYNSFPHYVPLFDVAQFTRATLDPDERSAEIEEVLLEYELAVDPILQEMDELSIIWLEENRAVFNTVKARAAEGEVVTFEDVKRRELAPILKGHRLIREVRRIEERALQRLASAVPPERAEEFRSAHNDHLMDWVEEEGATFDSYLAAALEREGLLEENRSRLESIRARFQAARARAMPALVALLRELLDMRYMEGWYTETIRLWQNSDLGQWVVYQPEEYLEYEDLKREWRETVRQLELEAREILGEPREGESP